MTTAPDPAAIRNGRIKLLLVLAAFAGSLVIALVLASIGWQPKVQAAGLPILPQRNFVQEKVTIRMADGSGWAWRAGTPQMTLVALPGPDCAAKCYAALTAMAKAHVMLNQNQSRLRLLYVGTPPTDATERAGMANYWQLGRDVDGQLAAWRASAPDSVSAVLVESNGTALASYPAGFDPSGLLQDLRKVIK